MTADLAHCTGPALESACDDGLSTQYNLGNGRPTSVRTVSDSADWTPRFEDSDLIVEAWRWREAHPHGRRRATP